MKIEKINENQIRCTLTREELAARQMKLSELAYGTEKARSLFRDMMQQAEYEYGFDAEDIPLMIEAIPLSTDSVILVITKVEYPEELDTRFSKFSEPDPEDMYDEYTPNEGGLGVPQGADDILGLYKRLQEERSRSADDQHSTKKTGKNPENSVEISVPVDITKVFSMNDITDVTGIAQTIDGFYKGRNDLYKNPTAHRYYLLVRKSDQTPENFNKVCNILSEYASLQNYTPGGAAYYDEHYTCLIRGNALEMLARL
jgi:adapter protein MecA 1/2